MVHTHTHTHTMIHTHKHTHTHTHTHTIIYRNNIVGAGAGEVGRGAARAGAGEEERAPRGGGATIGPQVHPYVGRELQFPTGWWKSPPPKTGFWEGFVTRYRVSRICTMDQGVKSTALWNATVKEVDGTVNEVVDMPWHKLQQVVVLQPGEVERARLLPTGQYDHMTTVPAPSTQSIYVATWQYDLSILHTSQFTITGAVEQHKRRLTIAELYASKRARLQSLAAWRASPKLQNINVELQDYTRLCGIRCTCTSKHFTTSWRAALRAEVETIYDSSGKAGLSKFLHAHMLLVPSKTHPQRNTSIDSMPCKFCSIPDITPNPTHAHTFRKCAQRSLATNYFHAHQKTKIEYVLEIHASGPRVKVCKKFFLNTAC